VLVNGVPIGDDSANIKQILCVAYTGEPPKACFDPPHSNEAQETLWQRLSSLVRRLVSSWGLR